MAMADSRIEAPTAANPRNLPLQSRLAIGPTSNRTGYKSFTAGDFAFHRDSYFTHIIWPGGRHQMPVDTFLRALMRDVAWNFFYGTVNFDLVFGTTNFYGEVEMFLGA